MCPHSHQPATKLDLAEDDDQFQAPAMKSRDRVTFRVFFCFVFFTCRSPVSDSDSSNKSKADWEMHTIAYSIKCAQCTIHTETELGNGFGLTPRTGRNILQGLRATYLSR